MAEGKTKSTGVGFFIALLVVVPTATWVGMLIPSGVTAVVSQARVQLQKWGIWENPPIPPAAARGGGEQSAGAPAWSVPPWDTPRGAGQQPAQGSSRPALSSASSSSPGSRESRGDAVTSSGGKPPFAWAGQLIQEAVTAVGGGEATADQSFQRGRISPAQSGVVPATFIGAEGTGGNNQSGDGQAFPTGSLTPTPVANTTDRYSLTGWEVPLPSTETSTPSPEGRKGTNSGWVITKTGGQIGPSSHRGDLPRRELRPGEARQHLPTPREMPGGDGALRAVEQDSGSSGPFQVPKPVGTGTGPGAIREEAFSPKNPQVQALEARLRELGATYYRLEELDGQPRRYRFVAEFADPSYPGRSRQLEAYAEQPLEAIGKVIAAFESGR